MRGDHKHTLLAASFRRFAVHRLCNTAVLPHPLRGNSSKNLLAKSACSPKLLILCSDKAKAAGRAERTFKAFNAVSTQNKRFGPCAYHSRALLIPPRAHRISSCKAAGILRAEERCRFFGLLSALVRRFRVGRPYDLPRRSAIRSRHECIEYQVVKRRGYFAQRNVAAFSGFCLRSCDAFGVGRPHDLPCRSAIRSRHECISGVLYHNFGKNALYFAADMV